MTDLRKEMMESELFLAMKEEGHKAAKELIKRKLMMVIEDLEGKFFEREEIIRLMLLALFAQRHIFLIGKPGVGKTYLVEAMRDLFKGSKYWSLQCDRETSRNQLFGRLEYDEDNKAVFNVKDTVLDSHFVFLDEMFKSMNELLNSLLQIMNEGVYAERGQLVEVPLVSLIGASNELPMGEAIAPFKDRMPIWYDVQRIQDDDNFMRLISKQFDTTRDFREYFHITDIAVCAMMKDDIEIPENIYRTFTLIKNNLEQADVEVSDRKFSWIMDILRTSAVLNARNYVDISDLFLMPSMVWSNYIEKKNSRDIVITSLYGDANAITAVVFDMENSFNGLRSSYNREHKRFIDYMEEFVGHNGEALYNQMSNALSGFLSELEQMYSDADALNRLYLQTREMEKRVKENILTPNIPCTSYSDESIEKFSSLKALSEQMIAVVQAFFDECRDVTDYRGKRAQMMIKVAS